MASATLYLDKRYRRTDGRFPVKIKVTLNGKDGFLINTSILVTESQWDEERCRVVNHDAKNHLNTSILQKLSDVNKALVTMDISTDLYTLSPSRIKARIESVLGRTNERYTVNRHFEKVIAQKIKPSTRELYCQTYLKVQSFDNRDLRFEDINYTWLQNFERYLFNVGLSINSINLHMRNVRAVINDAINNDLAPQNCYPFRKFKIKKESTPKLSLTVEQLRQIRDWPCEAHERKYIDIFMLIFYLRGINIIDLCHLKEIRNGRIDYRRIKTGALYSVKVEPEALEIIDRYRGKSHLLNILDTYKDYHSYLHRLNLNLKRFGITEIGKHGKKNKKPAFPFLHTYYARHTWATLAGKLDIPKETIRAGLGHSSNTTTDIYIDFDMKKVDIANRKIIDYVNGNESAPEA